VFFIIANSKMLNNVLPPSLALRLQEKLDAVVQSPSTFTKLKALDGPSPSIVVAESGDDETSQGNPPRALLVATCGINTIDNSDDESSTIKSSGKGYTDFSRVFTPKAGTASSLLNQPTCSAKEPTFPVKLHLILSNPEFDDIIAWLPHGRSWRILQQKAFEERVIPLYFRHGRYSSFARQVNGWGFRRVTHGSDYNSYYHEVRSKLCFFAMHFKLSNTNSLLSLPPDVSPLYAPSLRQDEAPNQQGCELSQEG
jgi:hypothetical protein